MRVVFLGCGYLGFNLSTLMKKHYEVEMWGIDSPYVPLSDCFQEVDVFDREALSKMNVKDAVVIDTVALIGNDARSDDEDAVLQKMRQKYTDLLSVLKEGGAKMFVYFSSGGTVYGNVDHPATEEDPIHPMSLYAKSKVMLEELIRESGINYLNLRLGNPFGGYQLAGKRQGVIPILIRNALLEEEFHMWISGSSQRDYFYIDDLEQAIRLLIENQVSCETINVGSGIPTSLDEVIEAVEKTCGKKIHVIHEKAEVPVVLANMLSTDKLQKLTGYHPMVSLEEGIYKEMLRIKEEESL